jgi:hypothetical protein
MAEAIEQFKQATLQDATEAQNYLQVYNYYSFTKLN